MGIGLSWISMRPGTSTQLFNDNKRTDEADFQGEFNCVPSRREQPKQCPRTYDCIQYSNRLDLQKKLQRNKRMSEPIIEPAKLPNSSNMFPSHKLQHKFLTFEFLGLKAKCLFQSTEFINQKFQVKIHESTASIECLKHINRNQTTHT